MRHRVAGRHLGRDTSHRRALYRNLVTDLLRYERITTTEAKAKEIRPMAEKIITLGRRGDLHARRQVARFLYDGHVLRKVFDDIAPRMADRPGGYLRITGLETRKGDGARMAAIELVDYVQTPPTPRPSRVTAPAPAVAASRPAAAETEPASAAAGEVAASTPEGTASQEEEAATEDSLDDANEAAAPSASDEPSEEESGASDA